MNWKLKCCYLEVATGPPMDFPISKLIRSYRLAWRGSSKAVTLSFNWHWSGSLTDRFQVCYANCWGFTSWFCALRFRKWMLACFILSNQFFFTLLMDLPISKLIRSYRLAWRGSNKVVTLSFNWHWSGSLTDRFQVCYANCWGFTSWFGALRFRKWMLACFILSNQFFFAFFINFQTFPLGVSVRLVLG